MNFTSLDWLGILAGVLTTISFIPLVLRILRTQSADDVSWGMLSVFATGTTLWIVWGVLQPAIPVIIANAVTLILAFAILVTKWGFSGVVPRARSSRFVEAVKGARTEGPRTLTNF
jgi:MtN3 and saliva related transmembrane protein